MIEFPTDYFNGEEIDGFYVEPMMKRCWAAQMELYVRLKSICDKHNIKVFADYGTLLGAIRHQGYIPWDDDFDVCMLRSDYMKFLKVVGSELHDEEYCWCIYRQKIHQTKIARFVNSIDLMPNQARLDHYHGFPYSAGIDIFPIDYIPRDKKKLDIWASLIEQVWQLERWYSSPEVDHPSAHKFLDDIAKKCNVTFEPGDRQFMTWQLRIVLDQLCGSCPEEEADRVGQALYQAPFQYRPNTTVPKEVFAETTELPFGPIQVTVCKDYISHVKMRYGEDYMTPRRYVPHTYPYYKEQEEYVNSHH